MNQLSAENLSRRYGERVLFEELTFGLSKGEKVALIANNGTGKTNLLDIVAGIETPDTGEVALREGVRLAYLQQAPEFDDKLSINELLEGSNSNVLEVIRNYEKALEGQENYSDATQRAFDRASEDMEKYDAWDYERKVKQILGQFNITDLDQKIGTLSGGQKKRLALGLVLLDNPDVLVLDEPTNHLDLQMIEWLEKYLLQSTMTLLMVTHDRYFLDRVCDKILELNDGNLYIHQGNYEYFLIKRAEREEVYATEIDKAGKLMKSELDWMRRMPKARTTKSKSRIDAFYETQDKANSGKVAQDLKMEVKMSRIGGKILELKKVRKSYDEKVILDGFDYVFKKGERIGIIGRNGVGKSTFLNVITGKEQVDSGSVSVGETIIYGHYTQEGITFDEDKRVIDILKDIAEVIVTANGSSISASQLLNQFMFPPNMQYTQVAKLSGGEKRRLYLLTVLIKNPNFLILDEPTNDLDLLTLNKLEEFLMTFGGCVIMVTHDRYFMDKLVDHLFVFEGNGQIKDFNGSYTEYFAENKNVVKHTSKKEKVEEKPVVEKVSTDEKRKLTFKEKFEYEELEKEIAKLEVEKVELEAAMIDLVDNFEELQKVSDRFKVVSEELDEKSMRWLELGEFA